MEYVAVDLWFKKQRWIVKEIQLLVKVILRLLQAQLKRKIMFFSSVFFIIYNFLGELLWNWKKS